MRVRAKCVWHTQATVHRALHAGCGGGEAKQRAAAAVGDAGEEGSLEVEAAAHRAQPPGSKMAPLLPPHTRASLTQPWLPHLRQRRTGAGHSSWRARKNHSTSLWYRGFGRSRKMAREPLTSFRSIGPRPKAPQGIRSCCICASEAFPLVFWRFGLIHPPAAASLSSMSSAKARSA